MQQERGKKKEEERLFKIELQESILTQESQAQGKENKLLKVKTHDMQEAKTLTTLVSKYQIPILNPSGIKVCTKRDNEDDQFSNMFGISM